MIANERVSLRAWTEDDIAVLSMLRNDRDLQESLMAQPRPNSEQQVRQWLAEKSTRSDAVFFVIADATTNQAIGFTQLVDMSSVHRSGYLGICLAPDHQGSGAGSAAIDLLEDYVSAVFGIRKILLNVLHENSRAINLYTRHGFVETGQLREHFYSRGQYKDVVVMEKLIAP